MVVTVRMGIVLVLAGLVTAPAGATTEPRYSPQIVARGTVGTANSVTFQDATGEDSLAPDITTVAVANDNAGFITLRINIPNRPSLTDDVVFSVFADTDANSTTGDLDFFGSEYAVEIVRRQIGFFRWDGTNLTRRPGDPAPASLSFSWSSGAFIGIRAADLGNTRNLSFAAFVFSGVVFDAAGRADFSNARSDSAPNVGTWTYEVRVAPPPPPPPPRKIAITGLAQAPAQPVAGKRFTVTAKVVRVGRGGRFNGDAFCDAQIGGRAVKSTGVAGSGQVSCRFEIPASAGGKRLTGSIGATEGGAEATRAFSARVAGPSARLSEVGVATAPPQAPGRAASSSTPWALPSVTVPEHLPGSNRAACPAGRRSAEGRSRSSSSACVRSRASAAAGWSRTGPLERP